MNPHKPSVVYLAPEPPAPIIAYCDEHGSFVVDRSELHGPCPRCIGGGKLPAEYRDGSEYTDSRTGLTTVADTAGNRLGARRNMLRLRLMDDIVRGIDAALTWCES